MAKVALSAQIMEVERELAFRRRVYPGQVERGKMRQSEADFHMAQMTAVRDTLMFLAQNEAAIRDWIAQQKGKNDG